MRSKPGDAGNRIGTRSSPYRNNNKRNIWMREERRKRRELGICVNSLEHALAYRGGRCRACWEKRKAADQRTAKRTP
jgi:hypothetical protein